MHREPGWPILIIALSALIIALSVLIIAIRILIIALRVILLTDAWCSRHGGRRRKVAGLLPL